MRFISYNEFLIWKYIVQRSRTLLTSWICAYALLISDIATNNFFRNWTRLMFIPASKWASTFFTRRIFYSECIGNVWESFQTTRTMWSKIRTRSTNALTTRLRSLIGAKVLLTTSLGSYRCFFQWSDLLLNGSSLKFSLTPAFLCIYILQHHSCIGNKWKFNSLHF